MSYVSLVVFTSAGREHLLKETLQSFRQYCDYQFEKTILAIDGEIDRNCVAYLKPDIIIESQQRKGYVKSIINAIEFIETEYFFWLEDDWQINEKINIEELTNRFNLSQNLGQVILAKDEIDEEHLKHINKGFYLNNLGFSANPCICKTQFIQDAFKSLKENINEEGANLTGFENYISKFMVTYSMTSEIFYKKNLPKVSHSGYLESTPREYHMIASLRNGSLIRKPEYLSGFGPNKPSLKNKITISIKLLMAVIKCLLKLWNEQKFYDIAFRFFILVEKTNDKKVNK